MFFSIRFTPYKAEQSLQVIKIQEKDKDEKHVRKMIRKRPKMKVAYQLQDQNHIDHKSKGNILQAKIPEIRCTRKETVEEKYPIYT